MITVNEHSPKPVLPDVFKKSRFAQTVLESTEPILQRFTARQGSVRFSKGEKITYATSFCSQVCLGFFNSLRSQSCSQRPVSLSSRVRCIPIHTSSCQWYAGVWESLRFQKLSMRCSLMDYFRSRDFLFRCVSANDGIRASSEKHSEKSTDINYAGEEQTTLIYSWLF